MEKGEEGVRHGDGESRGLELERPWLTEEAGVSQELLELRTGHEMFGEKRLVSAGTGSADSSPRKAEP